MLMLSKSLKKLLQLLIILLSLTLVGCTQQVGDSCDSSGDCDSGLICEETYPGGYCLSYSCDHNNADSCPDEAQCTYFQDSNTTYCLQKCNSDDECRSSYSCQSIGNNQYRICLPKKVTD